MLSLGLSLTSIPVLRNAAWSPAALNPAVWLDPSDLSTMFQERTGAAATTPAVVDAPVGTWRSKGNGGVNYFVAPTDAKRPILRFVAGLYYLQFDGVDDCMICDDAFPATAYVAGGIKSAGETWSQLGGLLDSRVVENSSLTGFLTSPGFTGLHGDGIGGMPSASRQNGASVTPSASCWSSINTAFVFDINAIAGRTGAGVGRNIGSYLTNTLRMPVCNVFQLLAFATEPSTADRILLQNWIAAKAGVTLP